MYSKLKINEKQRPDLKYMWNVNSREQMVTRSGVRCLRKQEDEEHKVESLSKSK